MVNGGHARPLGSEDSLPGLAGLHQDRLSPEAINPVSDVGRFAVQAPESRLSPKKESVMKRSSNGSDDEVVLRFQQMMNRFLEVQQQVMLTYLGNGRAANELPEASWPENQVNINTPQLAPVTYEQMPPASSNSAKVDEAYHLKSKDAEQVQAVDQIADSASPADIRATSLKELILEVVSERTGYPTEMLDLDLDMEGDLGIDSIKRIEILGTVLKEVYGEQPKLDPTVMEELNTLKSLRAIIDWMDKAQTLGPEKANRNPLSESRL
jgi:hypothetical protein